jgi:uncharacterized protein (DUF2236 family)
MPDTSDGYFPAGRSLLREVQAERLVGLFYGQRALCIGALMPLNYVGTMEHTRWRDRLFQRLSHTAGVFETVFFAGREEADRALGAVHRMHERVSGELPTDAGPTPAGTHYDAFDPTLMVWTVAVTADSARHFYELFVRRLAPWEHETLWQEYVRFGELFGAPREAFPPTYPDFRDYWQGMLASPRMHLTPEARYIGHATAFRIPLPAAQLPLTLAHNAIQLGSLPAVVRAHYGLGYGTADRAAYLTATAALRRLRRIAPSPLATGSSGLLYRQVAGTEARRIARGAPTPRPSDVEVAV